MRTALWSSLAVPFVVLPLAGFACGGGQTGPGVQAPVSSGGDGNNSGAGGAPAPTDSGPTTTTTTTLADGGDLLGAKLQQTNTVASTTGSSSPQPSGPHSHDPGRGPADIRAIIVAHRDAARACYDAALPSHPGIEGDLVMQWTIDPKGNVTRVSSDTARSQITEPSVVACIAKIIQGIQFASSPGGFETKAMYPFNFHPRRGQGGPDAGP
jgi:hypothetical protein